MSRIERDAGSFRDPRGAVFVAPDCVYRTIMPPGAADFESARGLIEALGRDGFLLPCEEVEAAVLGDASPDAVHVVRQPRLDFVSYPYEWCFSALREAALLHLDLHLRCLEQGFTLSDASAYNIQFQGPRPVFIDLLSIRPYRDGEIWAGHRQFCEQFLNPLLLQALNAIPPNDWYRGSLEGIPVRSLAKLLSLRQKASWNVLKHVVLQAAFQRSSRAGTKASSEASKIRLPRPAFQGMLEGLRRWIAGLEPRAAKRTTWAAYANDNSYSSDEADAKARFVRKFCETLRPSIIWDLGCNTGDYATHALQSGAGLVVGIDSDAGAIEQAYLRARAEELNFLPLQMPLTNPSPSQGWAQRERAGVMERANADGLMALALVHHLAIAGNVPLSFVVEWLTALAPSGVVEFVPKSDPMVAELLRLREDIFDDYSQAHFEAALLARADVVCSESISTTGRTLYWFARH